MLSLLVFTAPKIGFSITESTEIGVAVSATDFNLSCAFN
jgi:hypothetical protein